MNLPSTNMGDPHPAKLSHGDWGGRGAASEQRRRLPLLRSRSLPPAPPARALPRSLEVAKKGRRPRTMPPGAVYHPCSTAAVANVTRDASGQHSAVHPQCAQRCAHLEMRPTGQRSTVRCLNATRILTVRNSANLQDSRAKYCTKFEMLGNMLFLLQSIAQKSEKWTPEH